MDEHFPNTSSGFEPLQRVFQSNIPSEPSQPILPLTRPIGETNTELKAYQRGYSPLAIPPIEDPIMSLLTNMLMNGGRKGEAQRQVAAMLEILSAIHCLYI